MMSVELKEGLIFLAPTIGPRVYLARGASGWPETFDRKRSDAELTDFLSPLRLDEVVSLFVLTRETAEDRKPLSWHTIVGFLARTMGTSPNFVPRPAAIAFWAHYIIARDSGSATN